MSRYMIEKNEKREVVVGWDPPMGTFFAQEYIPEDPLDDFPDDGLVWWVGYTMREIPTIAELDKLLILRGVVLPPEINEKLCADAGAPWEPGPLQKQLGYTGKDTP